MKSISLSLDRAYPIYLYTVFPLLFEFPRTVLLFSNGETYADGLPETVLPSCIGIKKVKNRTSTLYAYHIQLSTHSVYIYIHIY